MEIVRRLLTAYRNRDPSAVAAMTEAFDPQIEWDASRVPVDDLRGTYRGLLSVTEWWRGWLAAWDTIDSEDDPVVIDAADRVFLWIEKETLRGRGSGIEVDAPPYGWVFTFGDGKLKRAVMYFDRDEALEAAGVSE